MDDICTYQILIHGQVDEDDLNDDSPLRLTVEQAGMDVTLLAVRTDQAGLIGLIRHLHGLGFVLLSITRTMVQEGKLYADQP